VGNLDMGVGWISSRLL